MAKGTMLELFRKRTTERSSEPALWRKRDGAWKPTTWGEYGALTRKFGKALISLGVPANSPVAIISFNRIEWVVSYLGAQLAGGVPVGCYTTSSPEQVEYILAHSEAPVAIVENTAQLDKVRAVKARCPKLQWVVILDPGTTPREDWVLTFDELLAKGERGDDKALDDRTDALQPDALATLIYTSGTTGPPKAVMLSHHNLRWTADQAGLVLGEDAKGAVLLSYLPLAHIAEQQLSIHQAIAHTIQVYFAEALDPAVLRTNIAESRPIVFFAVPRIWEKFKAAIEAKLATAPPARRKLFAAARKVGLAYQLALVNGRSPGLLLTLQHRLFDKLVFSKLRLTLGFDRAKLFISGAAPISREVLEFWCSLGLVIREIYGQSEDCGPTTFNRKGATRIGTVGPAFPGVEIRIAEDGEILVHGDNVFLGYYKDPASTAETLEGGWLHTGDVGEFDKDGYLRITDRKKDLIITSGGKKASPQNLEGLLKALKPLSQAMVVGEKKNFLAAIVTLDPVAAAEWAKERGLPTDMRELSRHPALREHVQKGIDEVNTTLAKWETIKRFTVLEADFTVDTGELTPTMKLKRKVVTQKYAAHIDALYAEPQAGA